MPVRGLPLPSVPPALAHGNAHVFVIVLENKAFSQALGQPYIAQLAHQYTQAINFHAVDQPALPHYLALTSGPTWRIWDDNYHSLAGAVLTTSSGEGTCRGALTRRA